MKNLIAYRIIRCPELFQIAYNWVLFRGFKFSIYLFKLLRPPPPFFLLFFILSILVLLCSYIFIKLKNSIFLNQDAMCSFSS